MNNITAINPSVYHCNYFSKALCNSCSLMPTAYSDGLNSKVVDVHTLLAQFIRPESEVDEAYGTTPFHSRCRAKLAVGGAIESPLIGRLKPDLSIEDLCSCPLHIEPIAQILSKLKSYIKDGALTPYAINERKGELKYVILRFSGDASEGYLRFVLRSTEALPRLKKIVPSLQKEFPRLKVISANIQPIAHAITEGPEEIILTEDSIIWDTYADKRFAFSPQSFSQVTHVVAAQLYQTVSHLLHLRSPKGVMDLYCGVGCFSLFVAPSTPWLIGVELNEMAIVAAQLNATTQMHDNTSFVAADVEKFLQEYNGPMPECIIANPPRRGLGLIVTRQLIQMKPRWIVISSCSPETLKKDLEILNAHYQLDYLRCFDMFPLTNHLEVLTLLSLREK